MKPGHQRRGLPCGSSKRADPDLGQAATPRPPRVSKVALETVHASPAAARDHPFA